MRNFLFFAVSLLGITAFAGNRIQGTIVDEKGTPIEGASVVLKEANQGAISQADGSFYFDKLSEGEYTLQAHSIGYNTLKKRVKTDSNLLIRMTGKTYFLDEITVKSLRATERSATDIDAKEIAQRNLGQDLPYLLQLTPSFVATSEAGAGIGYTGFRIRGTDAARINATINGVPLNDAESQGMFLVNLPDFASSLSSVHIQRGVGTSVNGTAAFGASINMRTDDLSSLPYADLSATYGSFNTLKSTLRASTGVLKNGLSFEGRLSYLSSDGFVERSGVDMQSYFFSTGYSRNKTNLKFISFGGNQKTMQAWNGLDLNLLTEDPQKYKRSYNEIGLYVDDKGEERFYDNQSDNYQQFHYQLHLSQKFTKELSLTAALHYTAGKGYYEEYKTEQRYIRYGLTAPIVAGTALKKTDLVRQKWLDNDFFGTTFSLNYNRNRIRAAFGGALNHYVGDHFGTVLSVRNPKNFVPGENYYFSKSHKTDANIYTKIDVKLFSNLFLMTDLQFRAINYSIKGENDKYDKKGGKMQDITQTHIFPFFNPKVGLLYKINDKNELYSSFAISNREPNRKNYTNAGPKEHPTSERLFDTEGGYRFLSSRFSGSINFYHMAYQNQLVLTGKISEIGEALTTNVPVSYRTGVELQAGVKLLEFLRWDGNLTLSQNKIKNFVEEFNNIETNLGTTDIAYSPNIVANSILSFNYKAFEVGFYTSYVGKQYLDNTKSEARSLKAYTVNNLSLQYSLPINKWMKGIDFKLLVNNILNSKYETNAYGWSYFAAGERVDEFRHFPQAGINFLSSVCLKF